MSDGPPPVFSFKDLLNNNFVKVELIAKSEWKEHNLPNDRLM